MRLQAPNLTFKHCFFDRAGGVSTGVFGGLNISPKGVASADELWQNLGIAAREMGLKLSDLLLLNQGVSNRALRVEAASSYTLTADGAATKTKNVALCLRTADCAPILLEDAVNKVIGAAHAGWRGAVDGIIENTIETMISLGAERDKIKAAVGPCIAQKSYEVDKRFYKNFIARSKEYHQFFICSPEAKYYFDLAAFCRFRLEKCGIDDIAVLMKDTYALAEDYYSYRRFTHQGVIKPQVGFGAQLSLIVMPKE
ncbi:MAG: peptidoglycan editing factor PgeF [Alphaproteobacteria bacterium]|nr:peptidoglycan editing factor PgeF [Alphaproteobacteria bacterium]